MIEILEASPFPPGVALETEPSGDGRFIAALPETLRELGVEFLTAARGACEGHLELAPKSGMFVNRPNNVWTVSIRPKKRLLAITVYGLPQVYESENFGFIFNLCRSRYSWFEVSAIEQIPNAIAVISKAITIKSRSARKEKWNS